MTGPNPFHGLLAYPITPLTPDDAPDLDTLARLVRGAASAGVDAVTVLASSGAGVTFDPAERAAVVRTAVESAASGDRPLPVHVAVSGASTRDVVRHARAAQEGGASGVVLAPFSYLPLVDAEVIGLFRAVADAVDVPVCFYNKPLQTGYDVSPDVLSQLATTARVLALKDPAVLPGRSGARLDELRAALGEHRMSLGLSGDPALVESADVADAWHTGVAALLPEEYVAVRRARAAGRPDPGTERSLRWLLEVVRELQRMRPVSSLHALATALGVPTAPPRGPSRPATAEQVAVLHALVARRPVVPSAA
ncbi:dihydrodipicolinate synthase family protein [Cellulosimicrobium sp. PMB13]|uniref:dihydrodipicolinate synthase family protein n=1 Tax=Cellulosimicrobium sp. PMB13 TaxID=3120158 RepID=UPI003F4B35EA